ncbi:MULTISPECIES: sulfurtransferase TusA family protein [Solibacillus]|uniref:Sulfurtransferase TusA family protein n=1 Tax=Solibacillus merdavium TaxID=2762218 RepID=A0ABR8XN59_9BACL|nr:sulfurtransferase TusA family protein [Solibacillus merdavium]MBD8033374.1 sulfurtransferase TusA family protein [Solibacillus merdavium]
MIKSDVQLDAKGLACPMPIVKTKKAMGNLTEGQVLEIQATDKGSVADLAAWSKTVGHQYIGTNEENGVFYHYIRKCNPEVSEAVEKSFEQTISNEGAIKEEGIILDVREAAEYAFGHIPGAKSIPMGELSERMNELDKAQTIYVICRTGTRSDLAAQQLAKAGFTNVYNVLPGMSGYEGELQKEVE